MEILETATITDQQKEAIRRLWNQEYPQQLSYDTLADFRSYLEKLIDQKHLILLTSTGKLQGWACSFNREGKKWFTILLDATFHRQGLGSLLLNRLKHSEAILNGWVVDHNRYVKQNGQAYQSPIQFYKKNGFTICAETRLELDNLSVVKIVWKQT